VSVHSTAVAVEEDWPDVAMVITASTEFSGFGKPFDLVRPHQIEQGRGDLSGPVLG
jgi:hypothetical protein